MNPTRCISSQLTTRLLTFRNPQGREENWILGNESRGYLPAFVGKVITTEIGTALLCVTASVESVAYLILIVGSFPLKLVSDRPLNFSAKLLSSSSFTLVWNLGNITVFNFFCVNAFTHESFARFSIDHWDRGQAFRAVMEISFMVLLFFANHSHSSSYHSSSYPSFLHAKCVRDEDRFYIAFWARTRGVRLIDPDLQSANRSIDRSLTQAAREYAEQTNRIIDKGAAFFKECILEPGQITQASRDLVLEVDAEVIHFVLTRCIYLYVFGSKKRELVLPFLKKRDIPMYRRPSQ